ncbi:MAG: cyclic nucleotide-binding domain-containing protein [Verrucomicrobia bacterium]|nr:cyclic nucleotide-binding domain-containing protein [Verrucomicrobiota bacterium]
MRDKSFAQGAVIFREGDEGFEAFRILEGRIEISIHITGQGDAPLGHLLPGDIFGEMALLDDKPRSATARALEPTRLHLMNAEEFNELFFSDPSSLAPFLSSFFERLRNTNDLLRRELEQRNVPAAQLHQFLEQGVAASGHETLHILPRITISPGSREVRKAGAPESIIIGHLPYRIGRRQAAEGADILSANRAPRLSGRFYLSFSPTATPAPTTTTTSSGFFNSSSSFASSAFSIRP